MITSDPVTSFNETHDNDTQEQIGSKYSSFGDKIPGDIQEKKPFIKQFWF